MRCSIELVPRSRSGLLAEAEWLAERFPALNTINIPDLTRFSLRSWQAAALTEASVEYRIPHLRARDLADQDLAWLVDRLAATGVDEVVLVAGDAPDDTGGDSLSPLRMIERLRAKCPRLGIYAALDPHQYRDDRALAQNLRDKYAAGATGYFSQPLFDLSEFERCLALLPPVPVFWGLSPVVTQRSQQYWETVNRVRFPRHFRPEMSWNLTFANRLLDKVEAVGHHLYLMPIRVDLEQYLAPLYPRLAHLLAEPDGLSMPQAALAG
jgi:methylenetetrahydrofolate reductase (NADPH)